MEFILDKRVMMALHIVRNIFVLLKYFLHGLLLFIPGDHLVVVHEVGHVLGEVLRHLLVNTATVSTLCNEYSEIVVEIM